MGALTLISGLIKIEDKPIYNKKNLEEIHLTIDFTNSTNNLNNRFLSNFKTQLSKNNELLYFAQQNKNNPPIKFKKYVIQIMMIFHIILE